MAVKNESQFMVLLGGPLNQLDVTEASGGEVNRDVTRYPKGLSDEMGVTVGIVQYTDLTLRVPYDPAIHDNVIKTLMTLCQEVIDITITPIRVCPERQPDGQTRTYTGCVPTSIKPPNVNRGGNNTAMFEMTFAVQGMRIG